MPKTKKEGFIFALLNAFLMAYLMCVYNITINTTKVLTNSTFILALKALPLQFIVAFIFSFFLASNFAKRMAFKIVNPCKDNHMFVILSIQTFTVLTMVGLMSLFSVFRLHLVNSNVICNFITLYCKNFIMAYPLQIFLVGPLTRGILKAITKNTTK